MLASPATNKRFALIIVGVVLLGVVCSVVLLTLAARPKPPVDGSLVLRAVQRFCAAHKSVPEKVTFSQLIADGYLGADVLKRFGASEVTIYLKAGVTPPQMLLMDALMPDGSHTTLMADGSVEGFSESGFQQAVSSNGLPAITNAHSAMPEGAHQR
jgi:hypothetical protein